MDGKFAVAAVDEDGEFDFGGSAIIGERIERGADGSACEKHIIDQDDMCAVDGERVSTPWLICVASRVSLTDAGSMVLLSGKFAMPISVRRCRPAKVILSAAA